MTETSKNEIHVPLSEASIRSSKRMLDNLAKTREETKELLSLFKSIQDITKSMRGLGIMQGANNGRSLSQVFEGERFRAAMSRDRVAFDATTAGKKLAFEREYTRLAKEGLKFSKDNQTTQAAIALNHRTQTATLLKMNNLQEAMTRRAAVEKRLGMEITQNNHSKVKAFRRQLTAMDQVVTRLKEEERLTKQISKAKEVNIGLERAQAEASRRKTMDRLFGDGGAGLFSIQTGIMANYMALNAGRTAASSTFNFSAELDESLRNLQAITRTTDEGMLDLKESLIDVSEQTKFTAVEVANAAVTLGQAGLSVEQIKDASAAVTLLATATGTDLGRAVDIATSTLGVFNMESSRMADVANIMTEAVNSSKLNIEKLTLGLQYSGNIAAQSGVRFEELTAAMGAMANAGIRSGSTLGTGMRQILIALQKPSGEFKDTLSRLGLTMDDVSVRSKGLYGVLKTLEEAGFTAGDAIRSFEVRAASAFNALAANKSQVLELEQSFRSTSASLVANETQMRALNNQGKRLGSVLGSLASTGFEPILYLLRDTAKFLADVGEVLRGYPGVLRSVVVGVTALGVAWAAVKIKALGLGLLNLTGFLKGATGAAALATTSVRTLGVATTGAAIGARALTFALGPIGIALGLIGMAATSFRAEMSYANDDMTAQAAQLERTSGVAEKYAQQMSVVEGKISELRDRQNALTDDSVALAAEIDTVRAQFVDMGYDVNSTTGTVDGLIANLQQLRQTLSRKFVISLGVEGETIEGLLNIVNARATIGTGNLANNGLGGVSEELRKRILAGTATAIDIQAAQAELNNQLGGNNGALVQADTAQKEQPSWWRILSSSMAAGQTGDAINTGLADNIAANANVAKTQAEVDALQKQLELLGLQGQLVQERDRLTGQLEKNQVQSEVATQRSGAYYNWADNHLADLEKAYGAAKSSALDIPRGQPNARLDAFNSGTAPLDPQLAELKLGLEGAVQLGTLTKEAAQPLLTRIAELQGTAQNTQTDFFDAGAPLRRQEATRKIAAINAELRTLSQELRKPGADRDALLGQGNARLDALADWQRKQVLSGVEDYDAANPLNNDPAVIAQLQAIDDRIAQQKAQLANTSTRAGGGSRRDPFQKREFNTMMEGFKSKFAEAEVGMEVGQISGGDALTTMQSVVADAEKALEIRKEELAVLQAKREAGTLSAQEQKRATELVSEEKSLLTFIRNSKGDILELSKQIGVAQADITATVSTWAAKNLNIGETMTSGITSALSTVKSSMAELFTSWANGTKSGKEAFKDFAVSIIKSIQNILAEMLVVWMMKKALGWMGFGAGTGIGDAFAAATGAREGTVVKKAATGTIVPGNLNRDSQLYSLMPGEGVLNRSAVQALGADEVDRLNAMGNRVMSASPARGVANQNSEKSPKNDTMNIYLVDERAQAGQLGPKDILAVVNDDISKGGTTKKLIKSVQMGNV